MASENLTVAFEILGLWMISVLGVLGLPQYFPPPLSIYIGIVITVIAIIFSIAYFGFISRSKPPEVRMSAYFDTIPPNEDQARFDYHILAGDRNIRGLHVQVAYGYGEPLTWAILDLRPYSFEEARTGKSGKPVKQMPLASHQEYLFTFLSIWAKSKRATFRTIDPPREIPFENIAWSGQYPEVYIRFAGLCKEIMQGWVVRFNEPSWEISVNPPVSLFPVGSSEGKALIAEREKVRKSSNLEYKFTVYSKDTNVVSMGSKEKTD